MLLKNKFISIFIKIIILWLFLFDISLKSLPSVFSSRKIILIVLFCIYLKKEYKNKNIFLSDLKLYLYTNKNIFLIFIFVSVYSLFVAFCKGNFISGNAIAINRLLYLLVTILCGSFFVQYIFLSVNEFIDSFIGAVCIESITALLHFLFIPVKIFYSNVFFQSGNLSYMTYYRAVGLCCEGALLSLFLSVGFIFSLYKLYKSRNSLIYIFTSVLLFIVNVFTGKTGLIINLITIVFFVIFLCINKNITFNKQSVIKMLLILIPILFVIFFFGDNLWIKNAIERTTQIFTHGIYDESIQDLLSMFNNMDISFNNFIFGTGITYGVCNDGTTFVNDSGYIKSIFGYGVIVAVLYYYVIYRFLYDKAKVFNKPLSYLLFYIIIVFIICELKEPFLLKGPLIFIILTISCISNKSREVNIDENTICN